MNVEIKTIPHNEQRYDTCGDYFEEDGVLKFRISDLHNDDYEFLISIHEQIEQYLTKKRGIKEEDITAFDKKFEQEREEGLHGDDEPGMAHDSPYRKEHVFATAIERIIAHELGVTWSDYDRAVLDLS